MNKFSQKIVLTLVLVLKIPGTGYIITNCNIFK